MPSCPLVSRSKTFPLFNIAFLFLSASADDHLSLLSRVSVVAGSITLNHGRVGSLSLFAKILAVLIHKCTESFQVPMCWGFNILRIVDLIMIIR